jgi:hypothetical protein
MALLIGAAAVAQAPEPPKRNTMKESEPATGRALKQIIGGGGNIPFDKRYEELTAEQKAILRSEYEAMPETDEPPFPLGGLQDIYGKIFATYRRMQFPPEGDLDMVVAISSAGQPVNVAIYKVVNDKTFVEYVAGVVMKAKYKPAVCGGTPCAMSFRVRMRFARHE